MDDSQRIMYEEAGRLHRYILNWRQALFAGFLIGLFNIGTVLIDLAKDDHFLAAGILALLSAPLGLAFKFIDTRNRQVYNEAVSSAQALEGSDIGPYTGQVFAVTKGTMKIEEKLGLHTKSLWAIYLGYSCILLLVSGFFCSRSNKR